MTKVLFIVIDALATRVVEPALRDGRLPNLEALVGAGTMRPECTSIFPSITPAATCTLATGCYPRQHGIGGAYWYDRERDEVAYFGVDIWAILNEGVGHYMRDFQQELNVRRLQVPTIFERIEAHGHLRDAVINLLWFRGTVDHQFCLLGTSCNARGSHGSLHSLDSTSPLIVAGLPDTITLPEHIRTVDVVPPLLGDTRPGVGIPRGRQPRQSLSETHPFRSSSDKPR